MKTVNFVDQGNNKIAYYLDNKLFDHNGRVLVSVINGFILKERYVDLSEDVKSLICGFCNNMTGESKEEILSFLNFEDEMFCS